MVVLDSGMWVARSQEVILGTTFQTLTLFRMVGGVLPLVWFMNSPWTHLKAAKALDTMPTDREQVESRAGSLSRSARQHPDD